VYEGIKTKAPEISGAIEKEKIKMKNKQNEKKLNWNNLTDEEQTFIERMINRDVLTLCNELVSKGFEGAIDGEYLEFENSYYEENEEEGIEEGTPKEMMQFFIVSDWLADKLREIEACVTSFLGFEIWGRCEYGQSLEMDYDLKRVVKKYFEWIERNKNE
tara:strand:+ start:357 stop:836 length:480 start_codon:yes stop_codon:yes gene_type:complete